MHTYYLRQQGQIVATVAIGATTVDRGGSPHEVWCRGIAVVGRGDQPCRRTGRLAATGRMGRAMADGCSSAPVRASSASWFRRGAGGPDGLQAALNSFLTTQREGPYSLHKAQFDVYLTEYEQHITGQAPRSAP